MSQQALFHESITDALGTDIKALGGFKTVAGMLWPTMAIDTGAAKLRSCLNPDQPHKLDLDEVLAIKRMAREAGSTATVTYEAQQLGYQVHWLDPEDEADAIRRELLNSFKTMTKQMARLEQLGTKR